MSKQPANLARQDYANQFNQPQTAPQYNIGDANARIKRTPDGHTQIEATQATLISAGLLQSQQAANALWDGTNWNRIDTAQPASLQVVDRSGTLSFYTAPAGANPIAWNGPYPVMRGGMSHATATMSANQSVAAATFTKVAFDTEGVDVLGNYDPALYRFVAPELGIYDVSASALFIGNADGVRSLVTIYVNGAEVRRGSDTVQGAASDVTATVSCAIRMGAGDYIEIFAYCSAATTLLANSGTTWLSISRVQ